MLLNVRLLVLIVVICVVASGVLVAVNASLVVFYVLGISATIVYVALS